MARSMLCYSGMAYAMGHGQFVLYKGSGVWYWRDEQTGQVHGPFKTRREAMDDIEAEVGNV